MGTAAERQTEWARLVIDSFVRAGVDDAVISPGSRSTPFVIAALRHEGLRCTSALDERSGAHYALGQARSTLRPSLLLCTSGSAAANYFPAVIEASEAGVPLIVLSADRPPELHNCGANQTTDQVGLYGKHVRLFANLGEPREDARSLRAARRFVSQAVSEATGVKPGPVHINAQLRKPLEPVAAGDELRERVDSVLAEPLTQVHRARPLTPTLVEHVPALVVHAIVEALDAASRPVILCGPADLRNAMFVDALTELSERAAAPILAEMASQFRCWSQTRAFGAFDTIWRTDAGRAGLTPDFVLQLGAAPISKGWEELSAGTRIRRIVVHPWEWADPTSDAEAIVQADIGSLLSALGRAELKLERRDVEFAARFARAESIVWETADQVLAEPGDALTEAGAVRAVFDALPNPSALVLGNSLPIRDVETWAPPSEKLLVVHSQRGVSGIDGVVSGAAGVASCVEGPTTLVIGDVSFLHDLNGLQLAADVEGPLVLVVINNGGGRIFEQLPIAHDGDESWLPFFTTPHDADLASAAAIHGCEHRGARTIAELRRALEEAYAGRGCTVVEAIVPPKSALEQGLELRNRVQQALARKAP
jgi:2-succinyl-5-enolpyruvyl-6-hydroxy-3-cyclohexene-1-carboxylate synthase